MKKMSFEEKLEKTKQIVTQLSNPDIIMEESLKFYKDGMDIVKDAQAQLDKAKLSYEELNKERQ